SSLRTLVSDALVVPWPEFGNSCRLPTGNYVGGGHVQEPGDVQMASAAPSGQSSQSRATCTSLSLKRATWQSMNGSATVDHSERNLASETIAQRLKSLSDEG